MSPDLKDACAAALPAGSLGALADLRRALGLRALVVGDRAWLRWEPGDAATARRLLAVPGIELYDRRGAHWFRHGEHLPAPGPPADAEEYRPLSGVVFPARLQPTPPDTGPPEPAALRLVRDEQPRAATALRCGRDDLGRWAEVATTAALSAVRAAMGGDRVLLLGRRLPPIAGADRFWGDRVLVPLGFRADPDPGEASLLQAAGVEGAGLLFLDQSGSAGLAWEVVPATAFRPLRRAAARLASGRAGP